MHANSVTDVPARLVALAALGGMPAHALAAQAASALDVLVHIRRDRDGLRRVEQLALWPAAPAVEPALVWTRTAGLGPAAGRLRFLLEAAGIEAPVLLAEVPACRD